MPEHVFDLLKLGLKKRKKNSKINCLSSIPKKKKKTVSGRFPIEIMFQNSVLEFF